MSITPRSLDSATPVARDAVARRERLFFGGMAIAMLATVIAGFGPTYYFSAVSSSTVVLTRTLHLHGAVFTTWMVLLVLQTTLVAAGRTDLHRRLGVFGAVLGTFMVVLAAYVPITRVQAGLMVPPAGIPVGVLFAVAVLSAVVFPVLLGAALLLRRRTDFHKRLVLIATLELLTAAVARLPLPMPPHPIIATLGPPAFFGVTDLFLAAIVIYDFATRGRIHPATLWGGLFLIASQPLRLAIGFSAPWAAWVGWLTS